MQASLIWAPVAVAVGYGGALAALWFSQDRLLYGSEARSSGRAAWTDAGVVVDRDGGEPALRGWVDSPGQTDGVIYFGGAGEHLQDRRAVLRAHLPHTTRYLVPYRGMGPNHGLRPREAHLKQDAQRLWHAVAQRHARVWLVGRSLGSSIAVSLAARRAVAGMVLITPLFSVLDVARRRFPWTPARWLLRDHHEVWRDAPDVAAPVLGCVAAEDRITPPAAWVRLAPYWRTNVRTVTVPHADHITVVQRAALWRAVRGFIGDADRCHPERDAAAG